MLSANFAKMLLFLAFFHTSISVGKQKYFEVYKQGVNAYLENRWSDCIAYVSNSMDLYFETQAAAAKCRKHCKPKAPPKLQFLYSGKTDNLEFYENLIEEAFCVVECKYNSMSSFPEPKEVPMKIEEEFESRMPYDYLQICYYNLGDIQKAATYAYSYLLHNPESEVMLSNLEYYLKQDGVEKSELENLEAKPYQTKYSQGEQSYMKKDYKGVLRAMEKCPKMYMKAQENCRALCEGPYKPQDNRPEFILAVADHYLYTLKCKQSCTERLAFFNNVNHDNLLPEMFNYLQYAYFNLRFIQEACQAVANYLTLLPQDDVMLKNKDYYFAKGFCTKDSFTPSKDVVRYAERDAKEKKLLKYVQNWSPFPDENQKDHELSLKNKIYQPPLQVLDWSKAEGFELRMGDKELNGSFRFVADGFANQNQCSDLVNLIQDNSVEGDGYKGGNPHTDKEKFMGLGVSRILELVKSNNVSKELAKLFLDLSEKARVYVERYFGLNNLYFDFTHLVCRTSLSDSNRNDLSHVIHSDNCIVQADGSCLKASPAYTWRDYSAILYLNNDFDGGDFIFSDQKFSAEAQVSPRCGRVVGFAADNWHGVKAVVRGQRCCLAMWYTLDPKHDEIARSQLYNLVSGDRGD